MKKRQMDFQKVKLKVGKRLPKGRNETKTSFQTRKINLPGQIKGATEELTLKELLSFMKSTDVKIKFDNLRRLLKYVSNNKDTLPMFFPDILKELGRTLQESEPKIRSEAISLLGRCAEILTDAQLKPFVVPLTSYLSCMMTHITFQVKQDSLKFLDLLLNSHCSVICQSHEILFNLLNMISCKNSSANIESKHKGGRKLLDVINSRISADEWRRDVLERMVTFFNGMLKKDSMAMDTGDQKEVRWGAKEALYLPLYLNSGIEPAKFDYSLYCSENSEGCDSKEFKTFVNEFMYILFAILKGFAIHKSFSESNLKYLSIITQVLCCLGEWAIENVDFSGDLATFRDNMNIVQGLITICNQLLKGFPYYQQAGQSTNREEVHCVQLNLGICYFYLMCSCLSENAQRPYFDSWERIQTFIIHAFEASGLKLSDKSISLSLKLCKMVVKCKNLDACSKNGILLALIGTWDFRNFTPIGNEMYSFFMDLTLDYNYQYLQLGLGIKLWFYSLFDKLSLMMESKTFVPNYVSYIKQACARRLCGFMVAINKLKSEKLINFLKFDDEDVQLTIIHVIVSLNEITPDFLQDLAETIRPESFSLKTASRLIHLLHTRYSETDVSPLEQRNFVKFLLNLCCDTFLIVDNSLDSDPLPLTDMIVNFQQSFASHCIMFPTYGFERHQEIFKVCTECLTRYLRDEYLRKCAISFIRTILTSHTRYPVHSVISFIELFKRFAVFSSDIQSVDFLQNFIYSCILYNSLITGDVPEDHWTEYCAPAVQDCLDAIAIDPMDITAHMTGAVHDFKENQVQHALRIFIYLIHRRCMDVMDKSTLCVFLNKLGDLEALQKNPDYEMTLHNLFVYFNI